MTPFQGFRIFSFNLSSRIGPKIVIKSVKMQILNISLHYFSPQRACDGKWQMLSQIYIYIYIHTLRLNTVDQLITRTHIHWLNTLAQSLLARSLHAPLPTASGSHPTCSEAGVRKKTLSFHSKKLPKNCTFNTRTTIKWLQRKSTLYHK